MTTIQIGTRICYKGDMANPEGYGAVVAIREHRPMRQECQINTYDVLSGMKQIDTSRSFDVVLEDGRTINGIYPSNIGGTRENKGCRFMVEETRTDLATPGERSWLMENAVKVKTAALAEQARKDAEFMTAKYIALADGVAMGLISASTFQQSGQKGSAAAYNLRRQLRVSGIAASVRQDGYDCLRVSLKEDNTPEKVQEARQIAGTYEQGHFDGMDDSYHYEHTAWESVFGGVKYVFVSSAQGYSL